MKNILIFIFAIFLAWTAKAQTFNFSCPVLSMRDMATQKMTDLGFELSSYQTGYQQYYKTTDDDFPYQGGFSTRSVKMYFNASGNLVDTDVSYVPCSGNGDWHRIYDNHLDNAITKIIEYFNEIDTIYPEASETIVNDLGFVANCDSWGFMWLKGDHPGFTHQIDFWSTNRALRIIQWEVKGTNPEPRKESRFYYEENYFSQGSGFKVFDGIQAALTALQTPGTAIIPTNGEEITAVAYHGTLLYIGFNAIDLQGNVDYYNVYMDNVDASTFKNKYQETSSGTEYVDVNQYADGTKLYWKVETVFNDGTSIFSSIENFILLNP